MSAEKTTGKERGRGGGLTARNELLNQLNVSRGIWKAKHSTIRRSINYFLSALIRLNRTPHGESTFEFATAGEDNLKKLVDSILGTPQEIHTSHIKIVHKKFGEITKRQMKTHKNAVLQIMNVEPLKAIIKFRYDRFSPATFFEAKLYPNPLYNNLPSHLKKHRIEAEFFSIELFPELKKADYTFSFNKIKKLDIKRYLQLLTFYDGITSAQNSPSLEIQTESSQVIQIGITPIVKDIDYSRNIETLRNLLKILAHFERYEDIEITYNEIMRLENSVNQFYQLISHRHATLVVIDSDHKEFDMNLEFIHITPFYLRVNNIVLAQIISLRGAGTKEENQIKMHIPDIVFEKQFNLIMDGSYDANEIKEEIRKEIYKIADGYENRFNVICSDIK